MAIAMIALTACQVADDDRARVVERGIALEVPKTWSVTGFSKSVTPPRLVAASYDVRPADVEGDCGGQAAIKRVPDDGAYLVLIDYGPFPGELDPDDFSEELPTSGRDDPFSEERFGESACFGPSYWFLFIVNGRALQAHIGIGRDATVERRDEAVDILNSIVVERDS